MEKAGNDLFILIGKCAKSDDNVHFFVCEIDCVTGFCIFCEYVGDRIFGDSVGILFFIFQVREDQVIQGDFIEIRKKKKRVQIRSPVACLIIRISLSGYVQNLSHLILCQSVLFSQIS